MSNHNKHRPTESLNKATKKPADVSNEDMKRYSRNQGTVAKVEGKTPPPPPDPKI